MTTMRRGGPTADRGSTSEMISEAPNTRQDLHDGTAADRLVPVIRLGGPRRSADLRALSLLDRSGWWCCWTAGHGRRCLLGGAS